MLCCAVLCCDASVFQRRRAYLIWISFQSYRTSGSKGGLGSMGSSSPMQKQSGFGSSSGGFGGGESS
jgi:hypothetical protein